MKKLEYIDPVLDIDYLEDQVSIVCASGDDPKRDEDEPEIDPAED